MHVNFLNLRLKRYSIESSGSRVCAYCYIYISARINYKYVQSSGIGWHRITIFTESEKSGVAFKLVWRLN